MGVPQKLPKKQPQGRVLNDEVQPAIVGIPRMMLAVLAGFATLGRFPWGVVAADTVFPRQPARHPLAFVGHGVNAAFRRLEPRRRRMLHRIRFILHHRPDETVMDEQVGDFVHFPPIHRRTAIHQPIGRRLARERVCDDAVQDLPLLGHFHPYQPVVVVAQGVRVGRGDVGLDVGTILSGKSSKNHFDRRAVM